MENNYITKEMDNFFDKRYKNILAQEDKLKEIEENKKDREKKYEEDKEYIGQEIYAHFVSFMKYLSDNHVKGSISFSPNYLGWYLPTKIGYCYVDTYYPPKSTGEKIAGCYINDCEEKYFSILYPNDNKIYLKSFNKYMYNGDISNFTNGNNTDFSNLNIGDKIWYFERNSTGKEERNTRTRESERKIENMTHSVTDDYHNIFEMELKSRSISTVKIIIDCENKNITKTGPSFELNLNDNNSILDNSALYTSNILLISDIEFKGKFISKQEKFDTKQLNGSIINEKLFSWLETIIKNGVLI